MNKKLCVSNNIEIMEMGDTMVIKQNTNDTVHILNATASMLFEFLRQSLALSDIYSKFGETFTDMEHEVMVKDIAEMIEEFLTKALIYEVDE